MQYNIVTPKRKGALMMSATKVKPIQPTIISDIKIIKKVIQEATTPPSPAAIVRNNEASDLLSRLQKGQNK